MQAEELKTSTSIEFFRNSFIERIGDVLFIGGKDFDTIHLYRYVILFYFNLS